MAVASPEHLAWFYRAVERARAALKPGDRITCAHGCDDRKITVRFVGWDGVWICSPRLMDIPATRVFKVNGEPVDFTNGEPRPE